MRGADIQTEGLFSYVSCEARVPSDHPLRVIRAIVDEALEVLSAQFDRLYAPQGARRSRLRSCCAHCCCKPSSGSAPSVSS